MKYWKFLTLAAASAMTVALATANVANATSPYYNFGPGTGTDSVSYNFTPGGTVYTSEMSRGGSGVVGQWIAPTAGNHGYYYQYKPLTSAALHVTTPFKQSCDAGLTPVGVWPYQRGVYLPAGVLDAYFPIDGLQYWVCVGPASNYATADYYYTVAGDHAGLLRHATFDVQMAGPGFVAQGTFNYSDTDGSAYTVNVTDVLITPTTVTFSGPVTGGFLEAQVVTGAGGTVSSSGGDVVASDPAGTLGSFTPSTFAVNPTGTMLVYTR